MTESPIPDDDSAEIRQRKRNPFFAMVLCSATIFVLTILAMVAALFGDPNAPLAQFLDAHVGRLIGAEVVVTLIVGLCALVVDRLQSRREVSAALEGEKAAGFSEKSDKS